MIEAIAIGIGSIVIVLSVAAWGIVQVLDVLEALALRKETRARRLSEARKYLSNPQTYNTTDSPNINITDSTNMSGGFYVA